MKLHANARTCLHGRRLLVKRVLEQGWTPTPAAEAAGVGVRTVSKWLRRYRKGASRGWRIVPRRQCAWLGERRRSGSS